MFLHFFGSPFSKIKCFVCRYKLQTLSYYQGLDVFHILFYTLHAHHNSSVPIAKSKTTQISTTGWIVLLWKWVSLVGNCFILFQSQNNIALKGFYYRLFHSQWSGKIQLVHFYHSRFSEYKKVLCEITEFDGPISIAKVRNHVAPLRCFKISAPILVFRWGTSYLYTLKSTQNVSS